MLGNGDVYNYEQCEALLKGGDPDGGGSIASIMIGRAALIKPWLFTEIKVTVLIQCFKCVDRHDYTIRQLYDSTRDQGSSILAPRHMLPARGLPASECVRWLHRP